LTGEPCKNDQPKYDQHGLCILNWLEFPKTAASNCGPLPKSKTVTASVINVANDNAISRRRETDLKGLSSKQSPEWIPNGKQKTQTPIHRVELCNDLRPAA
jgi:hypothetical protein